MKNSLTFLFVLMFINSIQANPDEAEKVVDTSPPGTEIVLANIQIVDGASRITNEKNITSFKGYDSQPAFMENDKAIYFTRFINNQTDIYRIDLETLQTSAYTQTPESEYSPTKSLDTGVISVVRVDMDNSQSVYSINSIKDSKGQKVSDIDNVGYHNWTSNKGLWMFVINQDQGNLFYQAKGMKPKMMAVNIGRSIKTNVKKDAIYYVDKSKDNWWINKIDAETIKITAIIELPENVKDFTIDSKGNFWCGKNNQLFHSTNGEKWAMVKEFDLPNLSNISRIAVNKNISQIALVFDEKTP